MPTPEHDSINSLTDYWRTLMLVVAVFGALLAVSWTIDAVASRAAVEQPASGSTQAQA